MGRRLPLWIVLAGVLLHLPALTQGFYVDDYLHQLTFQGHTPMQPWSLYDFGRVGEWNSEGAVGGPPWWTSADTSVRFFRPLTSVLLWLEHALFGSWAMGYALFGLAWLALLGALSYRLFRALGLGPQVAAGALAILMASESTVLPVNWTANRNTLFEAVFTVAAVLVVAKRPSIGARRAAAALLLASGAVLCKESGIVAFGLVALVGSRRLAVASCSLAVAYLGFLVASGYGTHSLFYANPWGEPALYARNLGVLFAVAVPCLCGPFPADIIGIAPHFAPLLAGVGLLLGVPLTVWIARRVRDDDALPFLVLMLLAALAVQGAAPTSQRLLLVPAVAAAALLASAISRGLRGQGKLERRVALGLAIVAGPASALAALGQGLVMHTMAGEIRDTVLGADVGPATGERREIVLLQTHNALVGFAAASTWAIESDERDVFFWLLQAGRRGLAWSRVDERTLELESLDRPFLTDPFEVVYLSSAPDFAPGTTWETERFTIEVVAAEGGHPTHLRMRLLAPLARFRFLVPDPDGRLVAVPVPDVGQEITLPAIVPAGPFVP